MSQGSTTTLNHPLHAEHKIELFDVFIAGSGPIGATYARLLVDQGYNVVMAEMGDQDTRVPGEHKKNEIDFQKDIDRFVRVIQGALATVSVPTSTSVVPTLDPSAWVPEDPSKMYITLGRNPRQATYNNLGAEAVARCVGGMSTHWTCATPEFLKGVERPQIFQNEVTDDFEWALLYNAAKALIGTSEHEFDHSIRHNLVLQTVKNAYPNREVKALPLACHRIADGSPYVQWHSANNVYGDLFLNPKKKNAQGKVRGKFILLTNTLVTRFITFSPGPPYNISAVELKDLLEDRLNPLEEGDKIASEYLLRAKIYITAAGAVATPQILANSGFGGMRDQDASPIPALGTHITEQPMTFCQIVLRKDLVNSVKENLNEKPKWWRQVVTRHLELYGDIDPLPIPFQDPEPQVTIPASVERPWHTQIHRDAFSYGEVGPRVDSRVVVDLRFFGMQDGVSENRMWFERKNKDAFGMPQVTFEYNPTDDRALEATRMMNDMTDVANKLGGYLPGSEPQFMTPGLALHLGGTVRLGQGHEINVSVADYNSQVWNFSNLYVAGNGVIPTPFGANPTLTSMCLAIRSAYKISQELEKDVISAPNPTKPLTPTPKEWVSWATNKSDPNYPNHRRKLHRTV